MGDYNYASAMTEPPEKYREGRHPPRDIIRVYIAPGVTWKAESWEKGQVSVSSAGNGVTIGDTG